MNELKIGYLYYDLMNLYGDVGNIKAITYHLKSQNIKPSIDKLSLNDKIDFNNYDLIYIGSGTEENRDIVLNNLLQYKEDLNTYIKDNKFVLATGNSYPLFGKNIINKNNNIANSLDIFPFYEEKYKRIVSEVQTTTNLITTEIYGFYNHYNIVKENNSLLFYSEGYVYNNFLGTYMIGPLLVRNPELTKYFISKLILSKYPNYTLQEFDTELDKQAYTEYILFKQTKKKIK